MLFLVQMRAAERKRRRQSGLPPLPNIFKQIWQALNPPPPSPYNPVANSSSSSPTNLPMPDLDMLIGLLDDKPPQPIAEPLSVAAATIEDDRSGFIYDSEFGEEENNVAALIPLMEDEMDQSLPTPDAVEVMRVWRDLSDGSLIVEMNGTRFQTIAAMQDQGLAKRFFNLIRDLVQMAKAGAHAAGIKAPQFDSPSSILPQPGEWSDANQPLPNPASTPTGYPERPSLTADPLNSIKNPVVGAEASDDRGIADSIEEFLQYRLMQTPTFKHRNIHIRPAMDGSIRIQVDDRYYEAVSDIADADARAFIQGTIREWEARQ